MVLSPRIAAIATLNLNSGLCGLFFILTVISFVPFNYLGTNLSLGNCSILWGSLYCAWQGRIKEGKIFIGVGGTKVFYGDKQPSKNDDFAKNRHLLQLNMINEVLPEFVSLAFGYDTKAQILNEAHLKMLEDKEISGLWVGRRAVAYDGFPTLGALYHNNRKIKNARCTTHLGSGGVSFAPAAIKVSRRYEQCIDDPFINKVLMYSASNRTA